MYVLDLMVESRKGAMNEVLIRIFTGIETQLRKVIPELCVNDVTERAAEVEMSSSNRVRGDPLLDWLQPFDENLVDEEEQRGDRVEDNEDIQDDDQEREGVVAQGERARPLLQPRLPSRREVHEHELTHPLRKLVCTLRTRSTEIRCASHTSKTR